MVIALSLYHVATLARVSLEASKARADLLGHAIYQRAHAIVSADRGSVHRAADRRRTPVILDRRSTPNDVTDAAFVKPDGSIVASLDPTRVGQRAARAHPSTASLASNKAQLRVGV